MSNPIVERAWREGLTGPKKTWEPIHKMEKLTQAIHETMELQEPLPKVGKPFQLAAEEWAIYCLRSHKGELLSTGLAISKAISEYITELNTLT